MSRILNNNRVLIFIIAILLLANVALLYFVVGDRQPRFKDDHVVKDRPGFSEFLKKEIKFSPQQLTEYDSLKKGHWKLAKPMFKGINAAKDSLFIHLKDPVIDTAVLSAASDTISIRQRNMDMLMFNHFRKIRNMCTEQQRPVYDSLVQDIIRKMMNPRKDTRRPDDKKPTDSTHHNH